MGCCSSRSDNDNEDKTNARSCTDVFWLCIYVIFWFLMVLVAAFSFVYGNPVRIVNGYDSFGNTCGTKNNKRIGTLELSGKDTSDKPYLLFYDMKELRYSLKTCIKQCPTRTLNTVEDLHKYYLETGNSLCRYDFNYNELINSRLDNKTAFSNTFGPCPKLPVYESAPVLNRCVPKLVGELTRGVLSGFYDFLNSWDTLEQILGDLYNSWREILGLTFISLVVSLFTISILHCLAHLVSYIIMILVSIASIGGTIFLWYTYFDIRNNLNHTSKIIILSESLKNETAFLWYSIIATIITLIILILVIVMRKQVDFLADLFKETSKCLLHIPGLFLQPLITFIILLGFFAFWIVVVLCLATAYYPDTTSVNPSLLKNVDVKPTQRIELQTNFSKHIGNISISDIKKLTVVEFVDPTWVKYMWWLYFIGLIWTSEFIMACQQMVIAGAVAHWYYRHKYQNDSHVTYAICKLIKYHLGSVALGSLLITIFKIPRLIMTYLHAKLQGRKDKGSECAKCTLKCCICCFYCLERFIRYLNHNAYTVIAIDGSNFCSAAKTAFEVLTSHALQVATINGIGDLILFLGKCFVTAVTGSIGLYFFRSNPKLEFYAVPTLLVCIFAFFVAHCILSLYEMVLDTVYLCMCQNGDVPEGIQLQNLENANNGNPVAQNTELAPIK
ncbi:hypothetical protein ILUMI_05120 [Ignelater luminosus]|uniref:Choline transporter-like protein n=1 Tax=Ignelater luminosus TaxID=2038154 RepID=A0A8K0GIE7_IGNLU|nr:hypothetical protein ILUMI_05120 [Ignelater luminosus]